MWGSVLVLALLGALNPVRIGLALLVISRPRPGQNLLAYWAGCLIVGISALLIPLLVLRFAPMFRSFAQDLSSPATVASSAIRHVQIGVGVVALSAAALIAVRSRTRQRVRVHTTSGVTSAPTVDSTTPTALSLLLGRGQPEPTDADSAARPLLGRIRNAWENGSLWVAFVIGLGSGPSPDGIVYVLAIIVPSGAALGVQVSASVAFVVGMLSIIEVMLVSYLIAPAKTQAVVRLLHDWAQVHRRKVVIAVLAVVGVALLTQGLRRA